MNLAFEVREFMGRSLAMDEALAEAEFNRLALAVFAAQFREVPVYARLCQRRNVSPDSTRHWTEIPALPTSAFKDYEVSSISTDHRTRVFYSSGTTAQTRSRHFHHAHSIALYEASLWLWFERHFFGEAAAPMKLLLLTPREAPHSSLLHMFHTVRQKGGKEDSLFAGRTAEDGSWEVDFASALEFLQAAKEPIGVLGTAFSFVHLLDYLAEANQKIALPRGSRIMETGGYKGRSRVVPKPQLRRLVTKFLGVPDKNILTEYGMSELGSQAYEKDGVFHFPPWARARIVSPENGAEVAEGETGLLRIFDLVNIWSIMALQTEDLALRRGTGFELLGRAADAEPRGCSLMAVAR